MSSLLKEAVSNNALKKNTNDNYFQDKTGDYGRKQIRLVAIISNSLILALTLFFILAGVGVGIALYFVQQTEETKTTNQVLQTQSLFYFNNLQRILLSATRETQLLQAHISVTSSFAKQSFEDFDGYTSFSNTLSHGVESLQWAPLISDADIDSLNSETKKIGPEFSNFWVKELVNNEFGNFQNATRGKEFYHPILYAVPLSSQSFILGFDITSEPVRRAYTLKARETASPVVSDKLRLVEETTEVPAFLNIVPVYHATNKTKYLGGVLGLFRIDKLASAAIEGISNSNLVFFLFDTNATTVDNQFLYSSTFMTTTSDQTVSSIAENPFYQQVLTTYASAHVHYDLAVGDRVYRAVYAGTDKFIQQNQSVIKWLALFLPWAAALLLILISIVVTKTFENARKEAVLKEERVAILEGSRKTLQHLLARVGFEEQRSAAIMNGLPDSVVTIDAKGKIIHVNSTFEQVYQYTLSDLESIGIEQIVPDLCLLDVIESAATTKTKTASFMKKPYSSKTKLGVIIPTGINISICNLAEEKKGGASSPLLTARNAGTFEAYIIVMKDMRERQQLLSRIDEELTKVQTLQSLVELDSVLKHQDSRKLLAEFCKKELSEENYLFLAQVEQYRQLPGLEARTAKQHEIVEGFLKIGAKYELNISTKEAESTRIQRSIAKPELFDNLERVVKNQLIQDTFARFKLKYKDQLDEIIDQDLTPTSFESPQPSLSKRKSSKYL